jgi:predicted transcriptional regulator
MKKDKTKGRKALDKAIFGVGATKRKAIRKSAKLNASLRGLKGKEKRKYVRGAKKALKAIQ